MTTTETTYMDTYMGTILEGEEARLGALTMDEAVFLIARKHGTVTIERFGSVGNVRVHVVVQSADGRTTFKATRSDGMSSRYGARVLLAGCLIDCHRQAVEYAVQRAQGLAMANAW